MSQALYRKYRSRSLDEIFGQKHITSLLGRAIAAGTINHAYLLTGPKGVGKTSIARIIAHAINDLPYTDDSIHLDIIEIDAASNNGVEDVRNLREKVHLAPTSANKKVYIIDEVHMLSKPAFNALLKTLEEPPEHVVFILATTDVEKLPPTIISRVQRFNFRAVPIDEVKKHLRSIADKEKIVIDDDALDLVARHGSGSFRDSIGLLDQLRHSETDGQSITLNTVQATLGIVEETIINQLLDAYRTGNLNNLVRHISDCELAGISPQSIQKQLIDRLQQDITNHPEDIELLDRLASLPASSYFFIKLLAALGQSMSLDQPSNAKPQTASKHTTTEKPLTEEKVSAKKQPKKIRSAHKNFSWNNFITEIRKKSIALASILSKSNGELQDSELLIYAGNKFNAVQLSSVDKQLILQVALEKLGFSDIEIQIEPTKKPSADSRITKVTDIMGGGEEVELDA